MRKPNRLERLIMWRGYPLTVGAASGITLLVLGFALRPWAFILAAVLLVGAFAVFSWWVAP